MKLELTEQQARKLITVLVSAKDEAQLTVLKDKRKANDGEVATIDLTDQLLIQLRKLK